jgi:hypothetical protein
MELKPDEIKYIERYIRRLEKDSRHWRWMRWAMLITAIFLLGAAAYSYFKLDQILGRIQDLDASLFSTFGRNIDSRAIESFVEGRISYLRFEFIALIRTTIQAILGGIWFVYSLVNWNRHIRSGLIAKALREFILKQ